MRDAIARKVAFLTGPMRRRILLMIGRAVVTLVNDAEGRQTLQLGGLAGEVLDNVERFQDFGLSSRPLVGAEAVLLALGGNRQHPIAVAVSDRRYRPVDLAAGEVCVYSAEDAEGEPHRVILAAGRVARIECAGTSAVFDPDSIEFAAGGSTFRMDANGIRQVSAAGATVDLTADIETTGPLTVNDGATINDGATVNDDLTVNDDIVVAGDVDGVDVATHTHRYTPAQHPGPPNSVDTLRPT